MKNLLGETGRAGRAALFAAILCAAGTAARAQVVYSTNFYNGVNGSPDLVNGSTPNTFVNYSSPNQPVDNLDGQNGWVSTDPLPAMGEAGTATQINGGSDYVGNFGTFFGDSATNPTNFAGAIGGNQRSASPTAAAPNVVPSAASGGNVTLSHSLTNISATTRSLTLDVDLVLTSPVTFMSRDSFSLTLGSASTSLITFNFTPSTAVAGQPAADNISTTIGTAANVSTSAALILSSQYHFHLVLTSGASGTYAATFTPASGGQIGASNGSLSTASITLASVSQFSLGWSLADKSTISNGGYTGAGDNTLGFDNLLIVPEPSTDAMVVLGLFGLVGFRGWNRRRV